MSTTTPAPAATPSPRVAFQGDHGAYSEEAVLQYWGGDVVPVPTDSCEHVARLVADGAVDAGLLAVENTLAGSVVATYDALAASADRVTLVGEVILAIRHCLLAPPGATLEGLEMVESHPIALAQCGRWLGARPGLAVHAAWDTAGSARAVADARDPRRAAIAGRGAADRFGLAVLAEGIEDRSDNQTRFLVLSRTTRALRDGTPARTGLLATTDNAPGALVALLAPLAAHGLNLSALESRPTGEPWTYRFFLEVEHPAGDEALDAALPALRAAARDLRVLGTWKRAAGPGTRLTPTAGAPAVRGADAPEWVARTLAEVRDVVLA